MGEEGEVPANTISALKYESRLDLAIDRGGIDSAKSKRYYPDSILILEACIGVSRQAV
jgi:hypothetical protein